MEIINPQTSLSAAENIVRSITPDYIFTHLELSYIYLYLIADPRSFGLNHHPPAYIMSEQLKSITIGDRDYPWPLAGYENAPELPDEKNDDGKSFKNNANESLSKAYEEFTDPLKKDRRGGLYDIPLAPNYDSREQGRR